MARQRVRTRQPKSALRARRNKIGLGSKLSFLWSAANPYIDAKFGRKGTVVGSPTIKALPITDNLAVKFGGSQRITFPGATTTVDDAITLCVGFVCPTGVTAMVTGTSAGTDAGVSIYVTSARDLQFFLHGVAGVSSGITLTAGDPYLIVMSNLRNSGLYTFVRNLRTEVLQTSAVGTSSLAIIAGDGVRYVGGSSTYTAFNESIFFAAHFDGLFIGQTQTQIKEILDSPWGFWGKKQSRSRFAPTVAGIAFESAGNGGDQAAASSYSGSASWSGTNRMLAIDVSMLGPGVTVTAMTYGGAACTFVGSIATVTSLGGVEQWRICSSDSGAPAAGANTLSITLSGSLEFVPSWAAYSGVHQTTPTEGFNSAQATNAGVATDASVAVTTVADNCWVHAAVVANDTSIAAGNTTRNNVSGTLGSGANEDNGAPKTPAGAVTMLYSGMGITTTWAIAGFAIRPIAASGVTGKVRLLYGLLRSSLLGRLVS